MKSLNRIFIFVFFSLIGFAVLPYFMAFLGMLLAYDFHLSIGGTAWAIIGSEWIGIGLSVYFGYVMQRWFNEYSLRGRKKE